jgi:hypothetical protein
MEDTVILLSDLCFQGVIWAYPAQANRAVFYKHGAVQMEALAR